MAKILLGFMGAGKSTVARGLAQDFVDMDELLCQRLGMSIKDFFDQHGEAAFRSAEAQLLAELIDTDLVVSTGGGVVVSPENRRLLAQNADNIYLKADFETLYQRIQQDAVQERPLFLNQSKSDLQQIFEQRQAWYEEVATQIVDTRLKSPQEIIEEIHENSIFRS